MIDIFFNFNLIKNGNSTISSYDDVFTLKQHNKPKTCKRSKKVCGMCGLLLQKGNGDIVHESVVHKNFLSIKCNGFYREITYSILLCKKCYNTYFNKVVTK